ncbi:MAG TPA: DUF4189 domain-containing protein [Stellaceae bacterium]|jgi:hypothetical protein|nr:DUF4189 domain-containing protein [Stellaceae bacterium]
MRKTGIFMAAVTVAIVTSGAHAFAAFGAIAYDQATGRYGFSWDQSSQDRANGAARKDCGADACRMIPIPPAKCGALATTTDFKKSNAWAAAVRDQKPAAELAAMQDCQKHTAGQCKIIGSDCSRP